MPAPVWRTTLFWNVTSSTVDHGAPPSWLRTVKSTAKPFWESRQLPSSRLPSMSTRRAFFSSSRFFTDHVLPSYPGSPAFHARGFARWFRRISMSEGRDP